MKGMIVFVLVLSGCISFGSGSNESVIDRVKAECTEAGGVWTRLGCESALLDLECVEAGFKLEAGSCNISVGEE